MAEYIEMQDVIKAIQYRVCQGQGNKEHICKRGSCAYCGIMDIMDDIEALPTADLQPVNRWISAEDRLPEECKNVIVIYKGDLFISFRYDYNYWYGIGRQKIDYWQPLPEPPKDGDANE